MIYAKIEVIENKEQLIIISAEEQSEGYYPVVFNQVPPYDQLVQYVVAGVGALVGGSIYPGYQVLPVENDDESNEEN